MLWRRDIKMQNKTIKTTKVENAWGKKKTFQKHFAFKRSRPTTTFLL